MRTELAVNLTSDRCMRSLTPQVCWEFAFGLEFLHNNSLKISGEVFWTMNAKSFDSLNLWSLYYD